MDHEDDGTALESALHHMAAELLDKGMVDEAWKTYCIQRWLRL